MSRPAYGERPARDLRPLARPPRRGSIIEGAFWMVAISLALFFLPLINGLVGGLVGGYRVGSVRRGLIAAFVPAVLASLGLWGILALLDHPVIGLIAGATTAVVVILADLGIFIGAAIGGKMAERNHGQPPSTLL